MESEMKMGGLVSVIVPVYNVKPYLAQCVDSILAQSYQKLDVILVDDGSTDGSGEVCDEYALTDPRVRVIHKENGGLSSARNSGIDAAAGEWISFIDSDDYVDRGMIESLLAGCVDNAASISCCGIRKFDDAGGRTISTYRPDGDKVVGSSEFIEMMTREDGPMFAACNKLYRRSLWRRARFPVGRNWEDIATTYKVVDAAKRVALVSQALYSYRVRGDSITMQGKSAIGYADFEKSSRQFLKWAYRGHPELVGAAEAFYLRVLLFIAGRASTCRDRRFYLENRRRIIAFQKREAYRPRLRRPEKAKILLIRLGLFYRAYPFLARRSQARL